MQQDFGGATGKDTFQVREGHHPGYLIPTLALPLALALTPNPNPNSDTYQDKSSMPEIMQVKNFGFRSQVRRE